MIVRKPKIFCVRCVILQADVEITFRFPIHKLNAWLLSAYFLAPTLSTLSHFSLSSFPFLKIAP